MTVRAVDSRASSAVGPLKGIRAAMRHSLAPALVLLSSFFAFINYHGYGYGRPEIVICAAVLVVIGTALAALASRRPLNEILMLAAVLTFFADAQLLDEGGWLGLGESRALGVVFVLTAALLWPIRIHAARVVALMAGTTLFLTVLLPVDRAAATFKVVPGPPGADLPVLVHVVLDEHIGVEGLPSALSGLQSDLRSFYQENGFRLYGGAYSEHRDTEQSLGHLLNFSAGRYVSDLLEPGSAGYRYRLTRNAYFTGLGKRGYRLRVYQTNWVDMCTPQDAVEACDTHSPMGIAALEGSALRTWEKARLVGRSYLHRSKLYDGLNDKYNGARNRLAAWGVPLPAWQKPWMGPLNSLAEANRMIDDLSVARRGEAFVAHLIAPHFPYVYDDHCTLLPFDRWISPYDEPPSSEYRLKNYIHYGSQVRCTMRLIRRIIAAIPPELLPTATIVVHGDHGSRLGLIHPLPSRTSSMSVADYSDSYSTLFAVRSSGLDPTYDRRLTSITCILRHVAESDFQSDLGLNGCDPAPAVFIRGYRVVREPLPVFGQPGT